MAINVPFESDGDPAFVRVDTLTPAHELPAGTAAGATNKRFEQGEAWPRFGVDWQSWGDAGEGGPLAFTRFNDPEGFDNLVLILDTWRDGQGEDRGRGRAWRIYPGQAPQEIPLNGHDVWAEARLVPCFNGLTLLRTGNERHYFGAAAVDLVNAQIQLNCAPNWADGDLVFYAPVDGASTITGAAPPNALTGYYAKTLATNLVELYADSTLTTKLDFTGGEALGRFYLERRAAAPGYFGNDAPPLLMQPDGAGRTAFEVGFLAVPKQVYASAFDAGTLQVVAANHRLIPGDAVSYAHASAPAEAFFAGPQNPDRLTLHLTALEALGGLNPQTPSPGYASGDYLVKTAAAGQAMPPGREGTYTKNNRLVMVNGRNNVSVSDPLDPLHHQPMRSDLTANLGESDPIVAVVEFGQDSVLIAKAGELHGLNNFSGGPSQWALKNITREYGVSAPRSLVSVGKDAWGLGRKGVVSVRQTEQGELLGVAVPVSRDMQRYLDQVDWTAAAGACGAVWNNRFFLAVPLKGGGGRNNAVLVHNFLNMSEGGPYGWEGLWQGAALEVYGFARCKVFGEERLCFVNYEGQVCWLGDGFTDTVRGENGAVPAPIVDELVTRIYSKLNQEPKLFLRGQAIWNVHGAQMSVVAQAPGYQERQAVLAAQYDHTKYLAHGRADYVPGEVPSRFEEPDREDYSLSPEELLEGKLDVHQNITESFRMRMRDWGVQLVIGNAQGSSRMQGTQVEFVPAAKTASRKT